MGRPKLSEEEKKERRKAGIEAYKARRAAAGLAIGRPRVLTDEQRAEKRKACAATTYAKNREKILARQAARYAADPSKWKLRYLAWAEKNPGKSSERFRAWTKANPERDEARRKEYRRKNAAKIKAKSYHWRDQNPEKYKAILKKHRMANRVELNKKSAAARKANPAHYKAIHKRSRLKHPETGRVNREKRRARIAGAKIGNQKVIVAWNKSWRSKKIVACYWCRGSFPPKQCHADHIVALTKGGAHSIENLCVSCASCNHSKKNTPLSEWSARLAEPVLL